MTAKKNKSRGAVLAERFWKGRVKAGRAAVPGARTLPMIEGVTTKTTYTLPAENVLARTREILVKSGVIYRYGDSIVYETKSGSEGCLVPLTLGPKVEPSASSLLANVMLCQQVFEKRDDIQFPPPAAFVGHLLNSSPTLNALPVIRLYAARPVFDADFVLRDPGWHPTVGILVHGPDVEPKPMQAVDPAASALERLPHHVHGLLRDFCFRADADVVNAVAALLTGLLVTIFVAFGKAVVLLDGNQPGVGKTLFARAVGIILDGLDPRLIHFTMEEEELGKRICATLRGSQQSIVLIDNAKVRGGGAVSSPVIEANSMAAEVNLRILGQSANYTRPNDLLWFLTMNDTRTSPDLVSRGLPIRFHFDGDPGNRDFGGRDPVSYARDNRIEILEELAGMVVAWNQAGRPPGTRSHRCSHWAEVVGGILEHAGFPEFLANLDEAASSFNTALDDLAALAEAAIALDDGVVLINSSSEEEEDE